jgi:hypothetical protein
MASLKLVEKSEKSSKDFNQLSRSDLDKSYKKKHTYPNLTKLPTPKFRTSKSTCSLYSSKNKNQISFSDFWSSKMKAEVRNLEKQMMPYLSYANTSKNTRQEFEFFPEIRRTCLKSNAYYSTASRSSIPPKDLVPTIEKIIVDCDLARKKNRRLSFEILQSNKVLNEEYLKFSKNRVH